MYALPVAGIGNVEKNMDEKKRKNVVVDGGDEHQYRYYRMEFIDKGCMTNIQMALKTSVGRMTSRLAFSFQETMDGVRAFLCVVYSSSSSSTTLCSGAPCTYRYGLSRPLSNCKFGGSINSSPAPSLFTSTSTSAPRSSSCPILASSRSRHSPGVPSHGTSQ